MPKKTINSDGPIRMCVICRRRFSKASLARHVRGDNGALILDARKTRPGRGWYVCDNEECRAKFLKFRPRAKKAGRKSRRDSQ